ncbi:MAG: nickel pincer cofactor biosynthesis protein LarB [Thaumarchaeota archaeon]|nr:nickel pincer cofactor biosynthesis protein LarB [Nitrososphaerota archaeon]
MSTKKAEALLKLDALVVVGEIAKLDYNRFLRRGVPEIVYAETKTSDQLSQIVSELGKKLSLDLTRTMPVILSKVRPDQIEPVKREILKMSELKFNYFQNASMIAFSRRTNPKTKKSRGRVALLAAGTSDISALNESEVLLHLLGVNTIRFNDVGVAALSRLVEPLRKVFEFDPDAIIVAAGMEAALPAVIAGLSSVPVIGLPVSVGFGYGRGGEAALMGMLQACSLGISVVNIDGGVAAGIAAWLISNRAASHS